MENPLVVPAPVLPRGKPASGPHDGYYHTHTGPAGKGHEKRALSSSMSDPISPSSFRSSLSNQGENLKTHWALVHLATCAPFLSLAFAIYAIFALFLAILLAPLQLCLPKQPSRMDRARSMLFPPLYFQHRCVFSMPLSCYSQESPARRSRIAGEGQEASELPTLPLGSMIFIHLGSPAVSIIFAFASWTIAVFWILSALIADDKSDYTVGNRREWEEDDGKRLARGLIRWWTQWLDGRPFAPESEARGAVGNTEMARRAMT